MEMTTMLEKAARAFCESIGLNPDAPIQRDRGEAPQPTWQASLQHVRAVLMAIVPDGNDLVACAAAEYLREVIEGKQYPGMIGSIIEEVK